MKREYKHPDGRVATIVKVPNVLAVYEVRIGHYVTHRYTFRAARSHLKFYGFNVDKSAKVPE